VRSFARDASLATHPAGLGRTQVSRLTPTSTPRASTLELRPFDDAYLRRSAPPTRRVYGRVTCLMRPCAIYVDVLSADGEIVRIGLASQTARANHPFAQAAQGVPSGRYTRGTRDGPNRAWRERRPGAMVLYSDEGGMEPSETRLLPMRMLSPAEPVDHIIGWRELARGRLPISAGAAQPAHEWLVDLELIAVHLRHPFGPRSGLTSPGRPHDTARSGGSSSD
jgi:hypothetical protein